MTSTALLRLPQSDLRYFVLGCHPGGRTGFRVVYPSTCMAHIARQAFRDFGKGRHPARLNFGDGWPYAWPVAASRCCSRATISSRTDIARPGDSLLTPASRNETVARLAVVGNLGVPRSSRSAFRKRQYSAPGVPVIGVFVGRLVIAMVVIMAKSFAPGSAGLPNRSRLPHWKSGIPTRANEKWSER